MRRKKNITEKILEVLQKFMRFTKEQKWFIIYLVALIVFMLFFPIVSVSGIGDVDGYSVWLF